VSIFFIFSFQILYIVLTFFLIISKELYKDPVFSVFIPEVALANNPE